MDRLRKAAKQAVAAMETSPSGIFKGHSYVYEDLKAALNHKPAPDDPLTDEQRAVALATLNHLSRERWKITPFNGDENILYLGMDGPYSEPSPFTAEKVLDSFLGLTQSDIHPELKEPEILHGGSLEDDDIPYIENDKGWRLKQWIDESNREFIERWNKGLMG